MFSQPPGYAEVTSEKLAEVIPTAEDEVACALWKVTRVEPRGLSITRADAQLCPGSGEMCAHGRSVRLLLTIFKELAGETHPDSQVGVGTMIDLDILSGEIDALMAQQRDAWRELASPSLTTFDRREIRNRIKHGEVELRDHLKVRAERLRFCPRPVEVAPDCLANIEFRIL